MKAILVIDMPEDCRECPLCIFEVAHWDKECRFYCGRTAKKVDMNKKSDNCPLKPLPHKKEDVSDFLSSIPMAVLKGFNEGYNACVDEILGEEE